MDSDEKLPSNIIAADDKDQTTLNANSVCQEKGNVSNGDDENQLLGVEEENSHHESDAESWETVSEEMRAEMNAHQAEGNCLCETCEMKSLHVSNRVMLRSQYTNELLPETVTKVVTKNGTQIYIIGTAHFSKVSQEEVKKTIQKLSPDIVMVELCSSRLGVLKLDEKTLLEVAQDISFEKLKISIKESDSIISGIMQMLLLNLSAKITKELGMAPGGEFRVATSEVKKIPGCKLILGDRPIQATLGRAMASLSLFQKCKLGWHVLFSEDKITKEDVEKYKQKDMIAEMMAEMTGDFPELSRVFIDERDIYMANLLEQCGDMVRENLPESILIENPYDEEKDDENEDNRLMQIERDEYQPVVVGVVGIGHMSGIVENIGKPRRDLKELCIVPPPSRASRTIRQFFKAAIVAAVSWGVYSIVAKFVKK